MAVFRVPQRTSVGRLGQDVTPAPFPPGRPRKNREDPEKVATRHYVESVIMHEVGEVGDVVLRSNPEE